MLISICVATYKREQLLRKLLESLLVQVIPENISVEVIIVDNDPVETARTVAEEYFAKSDITFKYFTQPEKNISLTRNKAVKEAKGEYIAFIDDDEIADKDWLKNLYSAINDYNADAVFGKVISYFDEATPLWIRNTFLYNRPEPATGSVAEVTRSGNCMIKSSLIKNIPGPFDTRYGLSGGEDTHLFISLSKRGAKYVNCFEAITYEYVPAERSTYKWLIKRAFRTGNTYALQVFEFTDSNLLFEKVKMFFIGITYTFMSVILFLINLFRKEARLHWMLKICANIGKVYALFGKRVQEYK
jgi:succinoglycan biosynthesis protein ExoM